MAQRSLIVVVSLLGVSPVTARLGNTSTSTFASGGAIASNSSGFLASSSSISTAASSSVASGDIAGSERARGGDSQSMQARANGGAATVDAASGINWTDALLRGGPARRSEYWSEVPMEASESLSNDLHGYEYLATTTRYGDTCCSACGTMNTAELVAGTDFYSVASAESMQSLFGFGSCCWCGQAGSGCGRGSGTAAMGCFGCARGRFLRKRPYPGRIWAGDAIFEREIKLVVGDICPYLGNEAWCPERPGQSNKFGAKNHFDFSEPPPDYDNFYMAFTPMQCPSSLLERMTGGKGRCHL